MAAPSYSDVNKKLKEKMSAAKPVAAPEAPSQPAEPSALESVATDVGGSMLSLLPQALGYAFGGKAGLDRQIAREKEQADLFERQRNRQSEIDQQAAQLAAQAQRLALEQKKADAEEQYKQQKLEIDQMDAQTKRMQALADKSKEKKGKELTAQQTEALSSQDASLKQLDDLEALMGANTRAMGPIAGRIGPWNPYDTTAKSIDAAAKLAAQNIGKSLESGKLTDADIERYRAMLPNIKDTPKVAIEKINMVRRLVAQKRESDLGSFGRAGYNVSSFEPVAPKELSKNLLGTGDKIDAGNTAVADEPDLRIVDGELYEKKGGRWVPVK